MTPSPRPISVTPNKLLGLEVIRFLSAISVLLWHFQHFSFVEDKPQNFSRNLQPLYSYLEIFYQHGFYGVQIFWCISGFIFFWKYRDAISCGRVSGVGFFVLRFSRLYPLHIVTLVLVALLQGEFSLQTQSYFVYPFNDVKHFIAQLFFASNWGIVRGYSFNGPIWSISIEVVVYFLFFITLRVAGKSAWVNVGMLTLCGFAYLLKAPLTIVGCIAFFYAGGLSAILLQKTTGTKWEGISVLIVIIFLALAPWWAWRTRLFEQPEMILVGLLAYTPALIFVASRDFSVGANAQRVIEAAGNMTYSSYLIHFPIQLMVVIMSSHMGWRIPHYSPWLLGGYLATTLAAAYLIYRFFEMPAQAFIRSKFK